MIGTLFLWLFWPSFNGAIAVGNTAHRAIVNTILSLTGSCVTAFLSSHALRREAKFSMVDIQNATLAGGVAMGACADLIITPGPAVAIGAIAGLVSVCGFAFVQAWLEEKIGLHDTCGVNNLHGMPSIIGAVAAVIAAYEASFDTYGPDQMALIYPARITERSASLQASYQLAFMVITMSIGFFSGLITGGIVKSSLFDPIDDNVLFQDDADWEVPELEIPYYYDHRGEVSRDHNNQAEALLAAGSERDRKDSSSTAGSHQAISTRISALEAQIHALTRAKQISPPPSSAGSSRLEQVFEKILFKLDEKSQ